MKRFRIPKGHVEECGSWEKTIMRFLNTDKLRRPTNGRFTDCACATTCFDRNQFKDCCDLLTLFSNITSKFILAFVTVSVSVSSAYSQSEDLQLTCSFVKHENPVEKEGFIWKKEVITVEYEFVNVSGENLMIPDPNRYSPLDFMFKTSDGDTLGFNAKILEPLSASFVIIRSLRLIKVDQLSLK